MDTLAEKGWSEKGNGELLDLAERDGYDVLVTTDQSLPHLELTHFRGHIQRRGRKEGSTMARKQRRYPPEFRGPRKGQSTSSATF